jgi:hypothetical protein
MESAAKVGFRVLCVLTAIGTLVYPTYPNYDSYYSLLWGREILHAHKPQFEGFRAPTEHPLALIAGAVLDVSGQIADRIWIILIWATFLALIAGVYRLGRVAFTPLVGIVAGILVLSRFDFAFLAARGYIDIPYLALIVWAFALEAEQRRRGTPVLALLAAAGLLRPEAWLLAGAYWLWLLPELSWRARGLGLAWVLGPPLLWCAIDGAVTGDALYSLHYTSSSAEDLGRARTLSEIPGAIPGFLSDIVKPPVMVAGVAGLLAALLLVPRRTVWPGLLLASGILTFFAIGAAGLSAIQRYLVTGALAVMLFAAVAIAGWTLLDPGTLARRVWSGAAAVLVVAGVVYTALNLDLRRFDNELRFRGDAHTALEAILDQPAVKTALDCGPLTFPNHKLVPDSRWVADLGFDRVYARLRPPEQATGVAIVVLGRFAIFTQAWTTPTDAAVTQTPPAGWKLVGRTQYYAAYAHCR